MGFSVSAGTAIIVIAAFASVGMLYTSAYNGYEQVQDASDLDQESDLATLNTEINITNISHNSSADPHYVNVTAKNEGSRTLTVSETDLLLNGTYKSSVTYTISADGTTLTGGGSGTDLWQPHETLTVTVRENMTDPISAKLVAETGVSVTEVGP